MLVCSVQCNFKIELFVSKQAVWFIKYIQIIAHCI